MSSAKSVPRPLPSDVRDRLVDSATRVFETSFFAFVEPASSELLPSAAAEHHWLHTSVRFTGPLQGHLEIALPEDLARDVFAAFLGFSDASAANQAEVEDVIGESCNMVCGAWLTSLGGDTCFTLAHPEVALRGLPVLQDDAIVLAVNDRPVVVRADLS